MGVVHCCETPEGYNEGGVVVDTTSILPSLHHGDNGELPIKIPEDVRKEEKAQLKLLVRNFTSSAIRGVDCSKVDLKTGSIQKGRYTIDRWLRFLTLEAGAVSEKIEICRLTEVSLAKELPLDGLPDGLEALRPCLLLLRFADATEIAKEVAISEADEASCETFVTCMKILRLYAQVNS